MDGKFKNIVIFSQNLAPFRLKWANELSKYFNTMFVHLNEYSADTNFKFLEKHQNKNLNILCCDKKYFNKIHVFDYSILEKKYDLVIVDGYGYFGAVLLIIYLVCHRMKFIISIDGGFVPSAVNNYKSNGYVKIKDRFCIKFIKKLIFNSAYAFLSTSNDTDKYIKFYNKNAKIFRHYFSSINSHDVLSYQNNLFLRDKYRKKLKMNRGFFYVLFVGKFIRGKNLDLIFEISKYMPSDVKFILIGGKIDKNSTESYDTCNKNNFLIIDFLKREELKKYFYVSDVFIMPTFHDVWGLVIAEAFAFGGLPVISSDMCLAAKDMVENEKNGYVIVHDGPGLYFNSELIKKYVEKIQYLYNNRDKINYIKNNNLKKIMKYTIENSAKNDYKNFMEVINERQ